MDRNDIDSIRRLGVLGISGGALTAGSAFLVAGVIQPASEVPTDRWSFPWSSDALVPVSLFYAVLHALVFVGLLGYARTGAIGGGRVGPAGIRVAMAGTALLLVAELASIPVADQLVDDTGAGLVGAVFGVGTLLSAIGLLAAGIATVRTARWVGWRRFAPLATGTALTILLFLVMTPALAAGVGLYGLGLTAVGVAVWTQPAPAPARPRRQAVQV